MQYGQMLHLEWDIVLDIIATVAKEFVVPRSTSTASAPSTTAPNTTTTTASTSSATVSAASLASMSPIVGNTVSPTRDAGGVTQLIEAVCSILTAIDRSYRSHSSLISSGETFVTLTGLIHWFVCL